MCTYPLLFCVTLITCVFKLFEYLIVATVICYNTTNSSTLSLKKCTTVLQEIVRSFSPSINVLLTSVITIDKLEDVTLSVVGRSNGTLTIMNYETYTITAYKIA